MIRPALCLLAMLAAAHPAAATDFTPNDLGYIAFTMPSDNIGCIMRGDEERGTALECDRVEPSYVRVIFYGDGEAEVQREVDDQYCCGVENYLPYGETWGRGPFTCASTEAGLECDNGEHGFTMSRRAVKTF